MTFLDSALSLLPTSSFQQKLINVQVKLNPGNPNGVTSFAGLGDTVNLTNHRTICRITQAGALGGSAHINIFGLDKSIMDQLSQLGMVVNQLQQNTVTVTAGDAVAGMTPVFEGNAFMAYPEYDAMPEVPFTFHCFPGAYPSVGNVAPTSFAGPTNIDTLLRGIATKMGKQYDSPGLTGTINNPYYAGNLLQQAQAAASHVGAEVSLVPDNGGTLAAYMLGGTRSSGATPPPVISPSTGMIGYPAFSFGGFLRVNHVFNPQVYFRRNIQVQSSLPQANGLWTVYQLDYALDSLVPHGQWMGTAICFRAGLTPPPLPSITGG